MASERDTSGVWWLRVSDLGDGWNDISGHPDSPRGVVSGDVVDDDAEERRQRLGTATGVGIEELRDGLDVAA